MSVVLFGVQCLHQSWCAMLMCTPIYQYLSKPKYRLYYQIPHALTMTSYLLLDRRCIFLMIERRLGSEQQFVNDVDNQDKVSLTTIVAMSGFWLATEYARRVNNCYKAELLSLGTIFGDWLYRKLLY